MINPSLLIILFAFGLASLVAGVDFIIIKAGLMSEKYKAIKFTTLVLTAITAFVLSTFTLLLFFQLMMFSMFYWVFFDMIISFLLTGSLYHIGTTSVIDRFVIENFKYVSFYFALRFLIGFIFWFAVEYLLML